MQRANKIARRVHSLVRLAAELHREEVKASQDCGLNKDCHGGQRNENGHQILIDHGTYLEAMSPISPISPRSSVSRDSLNFRLPASIDSFIRCLPMLATFLPLSTTFFTVLLTSSAMWVPSNLFCRFSFRSSTLSEISVRVSCPDFGANNTPTAAPASR